MIFGKQIISNKALDGCREILTDEQLEHLGERYIFLCIRHYTDVPFHKYILYPDQFDRMAEIMRKGKHLAVELASGGLTIVASTMN